MISPGHRWPPDHLPAETLNQYLDGELDPGLRLAVDGHLAQCGPCASRLAELRRLAARLQALPDVPLGRDLSAGVVAALGRAARTAPTPQRTSRRQLAPLFAGQAVLAIILLAFAWPALAPLAGGLPLPPVAIWSIAAIGGAAGFLARASALAAPLANWRAVWSAAQSWASTTASLPLPLRPAEVGLALAAAAALWLLGNGLLFGRPGQGRPRGRS